MAQKTQTDTPELRAAATRAIQDMQDMGGMEGAANRGEIEGPAQPDITTVPVYVGARTDFTRG